LPLSSFFLIARKDLNGRRSSFRNSHPARFPVISFFPFGTLTGTLALSSEVLLKSTWALFLFPDRLVGLLDSIEVDAPLIVVMRSDFFLPFP